MKYKVVDKTAPRFRKTKYETKLAIDDLHKEFVEATGIDISQKDFRTMYTENMEVIKHYVETERNGVLLPERMGNIHLAFFKMKRPPYNYLMGMETGEAPKYPQLFTDLQGKIFWDYKQVKYKPRDYRFYGFVACRDLKMRASRAFTDTPEIFRKYIYMDSELNRERRRTKQLLRDERNNQRSDQPTEGNKQSSQLGQPVDQ